MFSSSLPLSFVVIPGDRAGGREESGDMMTLDIRHILCSKLYLEAKQQGLSRAMVNKFGGKNKEEMLGRGKLFKLLSSQLMQPSRQRAVG